jgi:hypothetical protein
MGRIVTQVHASVILIAIGKHYVPMFHQHWIAAASTVLLLATASPLAAHHSLAAEYEPKKKITLTGTIVRVEWSNPHSFIYLDATTGSMTDTWRVEVGSPHQLQNVKLVRDMLAPGTAVVIDGVASKEPGKKAAAGSKLTFPDGASFQLMMSVPQPPEAIGDPLAPARPYLIAAAIVLAISLLILRRQRAIAKANAE